MNGALSVNDAMKHLQHRPNLPNWLVAATLTFTVVALGLVAESKLTENRFTADPATENRLVGGEPWDCSGEISARVSSYHRMYISFH